MNLGRELLFLFLVLNLFGCQLFPQKVTGVEPTPEQKAAYRKELETNWNAFASDDFEVAFTGFQRFNKNHPQTIFEAEARLGEARSLEGMGEWALALKVYREIVLQRLSTNPEVATLAMYYMAGAAEALGNESEMMANLKDAEKNSGLLPAEIRLAALPARLAVALTKLDQPADAKKYLAQAEQGIRQLKAQGLSSDKWARLYLEMGALSTNQLSPENFQAHLDSFANEQIFLLKAIEAGVSPWSDRALQTLEGHYRDFWNMALHPSVPPSLDAGARERMKAEQKSLWLGEISKLVVLLRQNQRPSELEASPQERQLREFLKELDLQTQNNLQQGSVIPLTPEARTRQKLKREGTVRSEPIFPVEKRDNPVVPAADPNLKSGENK